MSSGCGYGVWYINYRCRVGVVVVCGRPMSSGCGVWYVPEIINYRCRVGVVMVCGTDVEWVWLWRAVQDYN